MTDSQSTIAARTVRILACVLSGWGVMLLIDTARPENDAIGYLLLVLGPVVMLGARFLDPSAASDETAANESPAPQGGSEAEPSQDASPEAPTKDAL